MGQNLVTPNAVRNQPLRPTRTTEMTHPMADIIDDFLTRLQQHAPHTTPEQRLEIELDLRKDYGGTEPYVGKRLGTATRTILIANGLQRRVNLRELFSRYNIPKTSGYRILRSK